MGDRYTAVMVWNQALRNTGERKVETAKYSNLQGHGPRESSCHRSIE